MHTQIRFRFYLDLSFYWVLLCNDYMVQAWMSFQFFCPPPPQNFNLHFRVYSSSLIINWPIWCQWCAFFLQKGISCCKFVMHSLLSPQGSCSRIWQRDSYWDTRPSLRRYFGWKCVWHDLFGNIDFSDQKYFLIFSNEYPLFIPRLNYCSASGDNSWADRSSSNFGVASIDSERRPRLDSSGSNSFNYTSASSHSVQTHRDLQKGISLLKKSVACITAYCYNSLSLDVPSEASTFEAFAKLLAILSSPKEVRSVLSSKMDRSRYVSYLP